MNRSVKLNRKTKETEISLVLNLDGQGKTQIDSPYGFFNHMLKLFVWDGHFDLSLNAKNIQKSDEHHLVEDTAILLGQAFNMALSDKKGINRYGFFILPMDDSLVTSAVDFSGRIYFRFDCNFQRQMVGDLPSELVYDFWDSFAQNARINLFIKTENSRNDHHQIEGIFKCVGRSIKMAVSREEKLINIVPSTKGIL